MAWLGFVGSTLCFRYLNFCPTFKNWELAYKNQNFCGASLVVQWLRFCAPNAGEPRFDPW